MEGYKKRFVNEFNELNIRSKKLEKMLRKKRLGKLDFEPTCPDWLLKKQHNAMCEYVECLKTRAIMEDIDLEY